MGDVDWQSKTYPKNYATIRLCATSHKFWDRF